MIRAKHEWCLLKPDQSLVTKFEQELGTPRLIAEILVNRGFSDVEAARGFLEVDKQDWHDPFLFLDMFKSVERIKEAIQNEEKIVIFGDYDADGVTSTAIMMLALDQLGSKNHSYYIPNRFSEGYGPNIPALEKLKLEGTKLIISVDTGISAVNEIRFSKEIEMDFIVTDHHQMGTELLDAFSIIHPLRTEMGDFYKDLSGAGVALKLAQALLGTLSNDIVSLAAIGTVSDLVALLGENRRIVYKGLNTIRQSKNPGLIAISQIAGLDMDSVTEESIGFVFAPRINAAGRLGSANLAVDLLLAKDLGSAKEMAIQLDKMNKERQEIVQSISVEAMEMVKSLYPADKYPIIVIAKEGWNAGVIGIVASKLVNQFNRPSVVLSIDSETGIAKGSARSINGFDMYENISKLGDKLIHFGGHPLAAGLTIHQKDIQVVRDFLCNSPQNNQYQTEIQIDAQVELNEINIDLLRQIEKLAPFGSKNPKPLIQLNQVYLQSARKIGTELNHLKAVITDKEYNLDLVGFGFGSKLEEVSAFDPLSLVGQLSINKWKNISKPQLILKDISCETIQIFDNRSVLVTKAHLMGIPTPRKFFLFDELEINRIPVEMHDEVFINRIETLSETDLVDCEHLVLIDFPKNVEDLKKILQFKPFSKIYLLLNTDSDKMFQVIPPREKFTKVYEILLNNSPFDYAKNHKQLAATIGLSKDLIDFIIDVFFDLSFVTIDNGFISVEKKATKKALDESQVYLQKKEQMDLEKKLLFYSREEITNFIQHLQIN